MRLTVQTDYALRVLMHVALQNDDLVQIADIAKDFDISRNHLVKIVHLLSKRGYLKTVQGRNGGIRLARSMNDIKVGQLVRDFEPDFKLVECYELESSTCRIQSACVLQNVLNDALKDFLKRLEGVTLVALIQPRRELQSLLKLPVRPIVITV